jgi:hypothetical protein
LNYRRGFHRAYSVLTVAWVGLVLAVSVRDRPLAVSATSVGPAATLPPQPSVDVTRVHKDGAKANSNWFAANNLLEVNPTPLMLEASVSPMRYWSTRAGIAGVPPAFIYLLLFYVIPWVYRGFRDKA